MPGVPRGFGSVVYSDAPLLVSNMPRLDQIPIWNADVRYLPDEFVMFCNEIYICKPRGTRMTSTTLQFYYNNPECPMPLYKDLKPSAKSLIWRRAVLKTPVKKVQI